MENTKYCHAFLSSQSILTLYLFDVYSTGIMIHQRKPAIQAIMRIVKLWNEDCLWKYFSSSWQFLFVPYFRTNLVPLVFSPDTPTNTDSNPDCIIIQSLRPDGACNLMLLFSCFYYLTITGVVKFLEGPLLIRISKGEKPHRYLATIHDSLILKAFISCRPKADLVTDG